MGKSWPKRATCPPWGTWIWARLLCSYPEIVYRACLGADLFKLCLCSQVSPHENIKWIFVCKLSGKRTCLIICELGRLARNRYSREGGGGAVAVMDKRQTYEWRAMISTYTLWERVVLEMYSHSMLCRKSLSQHPPYIPTRNVLERGYGKTRFQKGL